MEKNDQEKLELVIGLQATEAEKINASKQSVSQRMQSAQQHGARKPSGQRGAVGEQGICDQLSAEFNMLLGAMQNKKNSEQIIQKFASNLIEVYFDSNKLKLSQAMSKGLKKKLIELEFESWMQVIKSAKLAIKAKLKNIDSEKLILEHEKSVNKFDKKITKHKKKLNKTKSDKLTKTKIKKSTIQSENITKQIEISNLKGDILSRYIKAKEKGTEEILKQFKLEVDNLINLNAKEKPDIARLKIYTDHVFAYYIANKAVKVEQKIFNKLVNREYKFKAELWQQAKNMAVEPQKASIFFWKKYKKSKEQAGRAKTKEQLGLQNLKIKKKPMKLNRPLQYAGTVVFAGIAAALLSVLFGVNIIGAGVFLLTLVLTAAVSLVATVLAARGTNKFLDDHKEEHNELGTLKDKLNDLKNDSSKQSNLSTDVTSDNKSIIFSEEGQELIKNEKLKVEPGTNIDVDSKFTIKSTNKKQI